MTRAEIEQAVLEMHALSLDKVEFAIDENFKMTDEDFLHLKESSHANRTTVSNNSQ